MADFTLVVGDTPTIEIACQNEDGSAKNLTGATALFVVRDPALTTATISKIATIAADPTTGQVSYTFGAADFTQAGFYIAQVQVTYSDGTTQTFPDSTNPDDAYITIQVLSNLADVGYPTGFGASVQTLLNQTLGYLNGRTNPVRNKLNGAISPTDTALTLLYGPKQLTADSRLAIGLEVAHVWQVQGSVVTVERGMDGSQALAHPDGALIQVNPEYTPWSIFDAVNAELRALSARGIYQVKSVDLELVDGTAGYDLGDDVLRVLDVRWQDGDDPTRWTPVKGWELTRAMPGFPSGNALILSSRPGQVGVRVRYAAPLGLLRTGWDDIADTGLPSTAQDILPLGAAIRVGAGRSVQRVQTGVQPDPRNATEVRVQDVLNAWAALRQDHDRRVVEEAGRLARLWPYRQPTRTIKVM